MTVLLRFHHARVEERVERKSDAGDIVQGNVVRVGPSGGRTLLLEGRLLRRTEAQLGHVRGERRQIRVGRARTRKKGRRRGSVRQGRGWGRCGRLTVEHARSCCWYDVQGAAHRPSQIRSGPCAVVVHWIEGCGEGGCVRDDDDGDEEPGVCPTSLCCAFCRGAGGCVGPEREAAACVYYVSVLNEWTDEWTMWLWAGRGSGPTPI